MPKPTRGRARPAPPKRQFPKHGHPMRYVEWTPPRCPACQSKRIKITGHCPTGDASIARYARCKEPTCGQRFMTVECDEEEDDGGIEGSSIQQR